jgi:tagaturonate reductase
MQLNRKNIGTIPNLNEKIIQFGEGNFLRAFVDWMVQSMNETTSFNGSVVVVQPIEKGLVNLLNEQDGLYHTILKGIKNGQPVKDIKLISAISRGINPYSNFPEYLKLAENPTFRFIISNTTEAGIAFDANDTPDMKPPKTYPAKLTVLLYNRYKYFNGNTNKGFIILPCELIENNAGVLKDTILNYCNLWKLEQGFIEWLEKCNTFCNTLVDRIVPGFNPDSSKEIYNTKNIEDKLCVDAEQFHLWVIEGPDWIKNEFPTDKAGLNVLFVKDVKPYRTRKVRILNGPHTIMTPVAYLSGIEYVRDAVEHPVIGKFILNSLYNEIIPTLDLPENELKSFANEVLDRFRNPFVNHALMSISLNSVSKFKARVLPTLKSYVETNKKLPPNIVTSLASLIVFYSGKNGNRPIQVQDDAETVEFFKSIWNNYNINKTGTSDIVHETLKNTSLWGEDLTKIDGLESQTIIYIDRILKNGMLSVVESL